MSRRSIFWTILKFVLCCQCAQSLIVSRRARQRRANLVNSRQKFAVSNTGSNSENNYFQESIGASSSPRNIAETRSFIDSLVNEWFCYWDRSRNASMNPTNYIFSPSLVCDENGLITQPQLNLLKYSFIDDVNSVSQRLLAMKKQLDQDEVRQCMYASESDDALYPILVPWDPKKPLDPVEFLQQLGAHPEIISAITVCDSNGFTKVVNLEEEDYDEEGEDIRSHFGECADTFVNFMNNNGQKTDIADIKDTYTNQKVVVFYAGSDKLNPVLLFIVNIFGSGGLVGGFVSTISHT